MSIISNETWHNFSESERDEILNQYNRMLGHRYRFESEIMQMEKLFGVENLKHESKIKTWSDVKFYYPDLVNDMLQGTYELKRIYDKASDGVLNKCIATLKLDKLIEFGYGGRVSIDKWKEGEKSYCVVVSSVNKEIELRVVTTYFNLDYITFHTKEQADEFISYPENIELIKQYYIC